MLRKIAVLLIILATFLGGCANHIGNFSAISTSNFEGKNIDSSHISMRDAKGVSHCYIVIIFPICAGGAPKLDEAVSKAISFGKGDFMQNVRIYTNEWYIPFIFGDTTFTVQGDVYNTATKDAEHSQPQPAQPNVIIVK